MHELAQNHAGDNQENTFFHDCIHIHTQYINSMTILLGAHTINYCEIVL